MLSQQFLGRFELCGGFEHLRRDFSCYRTPQRSVAAPLRDATARTNYAGTALHQVPHAHQIVSCAREGKDPIDRNIDVVALRTAIECLARMIGLPAGTRIWIAAGVTDLRRGFTGLSGMVQTALKENPFSGHVFVFRGRRGDLIKMLWWDGDGLCLFAKRLERGRFIWPQATSGTVALTPAQLSMLLGRDRLAASSAQLRSADGGVKEFIQN